jgi:RNA polymerase sigma-70 factor, ECF subfamily
MEFEALYRQHVHAVFRFALSVARRHDVAEDLTSEAFLALHRHLDQIDPSQLPAWLLTVVRNRARDWWRRRLVEERHAEAIESQGSEAAEAAPPLERWILEAGGLKPVHRTCVMLRYVYGMSRTEISAKTGLTENQVKGHLQYALTLLRQAHGVRDQ